MRKTTLTIILLIALSNFITAQVTTINVTLDPPCITLGLPSFEDQVEFAFYPNPSNGVIYIEQMYIKEVFNPTIKISSPNLKSFL